MAGASIAEGKEEDIKDFVAKNGAAARNPQ
jgi:hypothetical protein